MATALTMLASALTALSLAISQLPTATVVDVATQANVSPPQEEIIQIPEDLLRAGFCETRLRHLYNGHVIIGANNPRDIGVFQINRYFHEATAQNLGIDLSSRAGNIQYALILYQRNGVKDWTWSYDQEKDQCKNEVKLPPRDSEEWKDILKDRGFSPALTARNG